MTLEQERDMLVSILSWYDAGIVILREGLRSRIAEYNRLVQENQREAKKPAGGG